MQTPFNCLRHSNCVGAGPLGDGEADGGRHEGLAVFAREAPNPRLILARPHADFSDVPKVDASAVSSADREQSNIGGFIERSTDDHRTRIAAPAEVAARE